MKHLKHLAVCSGLAAAAVVLFLYPEVSVSAIRNGLVVCANSILPSLFPFFVLSELWISLGYANLLSKLLAPVMSRLFHLPGASASALLLGAIGGYPVGARTAARLYEQHQLSREEAEHLLLFCNNAGPAFLFGIIGGGLFQSAAVAAALWSIHLASALLLGILFRPAPCENRAAQSSQITPPEFLPALTDAIKQGGRTAGTVCVFVLFFSVLSGQLRGMFPFFFSTSAGTIVLGSLELAAGCSNLSGAGFSQQWVFVVCSGLLGWGGLCVHCQTASALSEAGLSAGKYIIGKAMHALVSVALACLTAPLLPLSQNCFTAASAPPVGAATLLSNLVLLLILKSSSGKRARNQI